MMGNCSDVLLCESLILSKHTQFLNPSWYSCLCFLSPKLHIIDDVRKCFKFLCVHTRCSHLLRRENNNRRRWRSSSHRSHKNESMKASLNKTKENQWVVKQMKWRVVKLETLCNFQDILSPLTLLIVPFFSYRYINFVRWRSFRRSLLLSSFSRCCGEMSLNYWIKSWPNSLNHPHHHFYNG